MPADSTTRDYIPTRFRLARPIDGKELISFHTVLGYLLKIVQREAVTPQKNSS